MYKRTIELNRRKLKKKFIQFNYNNEKFIVKKLESNVIDILFAI